MQIFLICVYFLVYFCVYFFTRVFHTCFSHGICVQYGGFPRMKPMCNATMPGAFTVDSEDDYCTCKLSEMPWSLSETEDYTHLMIVFLSSVHYSKPKATIVSINAPAVHT